MTRRHFCTYFDHRYFVQGLALYRSLEKVCPDFTLWVLALDEQAEQALARACLDNVRVVPLAALEESDPGLHGCRGNRTLVEYYFTCSPCLPRYLLAQETDMDAVTYLDSDLYFFSSPEPLFAELEGSSVGIVAHRFSPRAERSHGRFGKYNVGWLTFARNEAGLACLEWWRSQCIGWCHDRFEGDRYADQKYLEQFAARFPGVHEITHPGANLAPWNVASHTIEHSGVHPMVDGKPLIFFHFQGLRRISHRWYDSNVSGYGARLTSVVREDVFLPYLRELDQAIRVASSIRALVDSTSGIRRRASGLTGLRYTLGRLMRSLKAAAMFNLVRR